MKQTQLLAGVFAASMFAPLPTVAAAGRTQINAPQTSSAKRSDMWLKGDYLPVEYYDEVIDGPNPYNLHLAPNGYQWIRIDDAAYLTNIESGFITEVEVDLLTMANAATT